MEAILCVWGLRLNFLLLYALAQRGGLKGVKGVKSVKGVKGKKGGKRVLLLFYCLLLYALAERWMVHNGTEWNSFGGYLGVGAGGAKGLKGVKSVKGKGAGMLQMLLNVTLFGVYVITC